MRPAPRQVRLAEGSDILGRIHGVARFLGILRGFRAPWAAGAIRQQVMRFMNRQRSDHSANEFSAGCGLLRRGAESNVGAGAGFPDQFVSILRMNITRLSRREKPLVAASCRKSLKFWAASANMRRLFGLRGGGSRQDASFTEEAAGPSASDEDLDALAACGKAKDKGRVRKRGAASPNAAGLGRNGPGRHWVDLIAKRASVIGPIGVIVSITLR